MAGHKKRMNLVQFSFRQQRNWTLHVAIQLDFDGLLSYKL